MSNSLRQPCCWSFYFGIISEFWVAQGMCSSVVKLDERYHWQVITCWCTFRKNSQSSSKCQSNLQKIDVELQYPPNSSFMCQPPADSVQGNAALAHYTWGTLVEEGQTRKEVYLFDKRKLVAHDDALKVQSLLANFWPSRRPVPDYPKETMLSRLCAAFTQPPWSEPAGVRCHSQSFVWTILIIDVTARPWSVMAGIYSNISKKRSGR